MFYLDTTETFDASEACRLIEAGWRLEALHILTTWSHGRHSETRCYVLGLPATQARGVEAVNLSVEN